MRYLAFDLGERRVGLAVGDDDAGVARTLPSLQRRGGKADLAALRAIVEREGVNALLFGLPLTLRGEEGPQAARARADADRLATGLGLPAEFLDERFTSEHARHLADGRRVDLDAAAAAVLLQDHLDRRRRRRA